MEKIRLEIVGLSYSQSQSGAYALILGEQGGRRRLPIIIGGFEAQAIAIKLEDVKTSRPLTHELFKRLADTFNIVVTEVIINKFIDGVFHAELICTDGVNEHRVDARTSDAVALALRFECPIYTYESIMAAAGITMDEETNEAGEPAGTPQEGPVEKDENPLSEFSTAELKKMLEKAVAREEYEEAGKIRDEINRRKRKK